MEAATAASSAAAAAGGPGSALWGDQRAAVIQGVSVSPNQYEILSTDLRSIRQINRSNHSTPHHASTGASCRGSWTFCAPPARTPSRRSVRVHG